MRLKLSRSVVKSIISAGMVTARALRAVRRFGPRAVHHAHNRLVPSETSPLRRLLTLYR